MPADRVKAGREHRVPLSPRAVAILRQLEKLRLAISGVARFRAVAGTDGHLGQVCTWRPRDQTGRSQAAAAFSRTKPRL
jgi:integrase